jgi:CubicO group peptidase (beta-lactamase class C family)
MTGEAIADPAAAGLSPQGLAGLTRALRSEIERGRLPGAVAVVGRGGRIGLFEALGRRNPASDAPMRADTIFRIFSMTKPIVSVAVMMLVEEGRLLLSDPLSRHLPEFAVQSVARERGGKLELEPVVRPFTVQDLLRHTSGLSYDFIATGLLKQVYTDAQLHRREQTNAEFCRTLAALPLLHQPGTHWSYSHATDVLGRLIEAISGRTLGEFLAERILAPLGMADTALWVPA